MARGLASLSLFFGACAGAYRAPADIDDGLIRNAESYWIIDPSDQTCLTELGTFGACDDDALFMYLQRGGGPSLPARLFGKGGNKARRSLSMVLEPVQKKACLALKKAHGRMILGGGDCGDVSNAQQWELLQSNTRRLAGFAEAADATAIALTTNKQKDCVVRDSSVWSREARYKRALADEKAYKRERPPSNVFANSVSILKCAEKGHTPLELHPSNVAQAGFLFQSADGAACYDGTRFRACSDDDAALRWGVGVRFTKSNNRGRPETALFKFYNATACLVEKGDSVGLGSCKDKLARGWGVARGRLCRGGDCVTSGKCLARSAFDMTAKLVPCKYEVFEHLTLTLDSDGSDTSAPASLLEPPRVPRRHSKALKACGRREMMIYTWSVFLNRGFKTPRTAM